MHPSSAVDVLEPPSSEPPAGTPPPRPRRTPLLALVVALRPHQWTKNALLFAALLFAHRLFVLPDLVKSLAAFTLFCALSAVVYLVNDLADVENDRKHPAKRSRPIASGDLGTGQAVAAAVVLAALALPLSFLLDLRFGATALLYMLLQVGYSLRLKDVVIVDVLLVSSGFVLRAVAGAYAIDVYISPWLIVCTLLLALFLALSKRRAEIVLLSDKAADHRTALQHYSPYLLDQMISVVTASTVTAYGLYTLWPTADHGGAASSHPSHMFRPEPLYLTMPFVIYGIFRYLYLVHRHNEGGSPSRLLLADRPLQVAILLWAAAVVLILYLPLARV